MQTALADEHRKVLLNILVRWVLAHILLRGNWGLTVISSSIICVGSLSSGFSQYWPLWQEGCLELELDLLYRWNRSFLSWGVFWLLSRCILLCSSFSMFIRVETLPFERWSNLYWEDCDYEWHTKDAQHVGDISRRVAIESIKFALCLMNGLWLRFGQSKDRPS